MSSPRPRISVIGCGYLGITHAASMAELGYEVIGVEISPHRLDDLRAGRLPLYEPGLQPLLTRNVEEGRLRFTDSIDEAARSADVHFICVGTPQSPDGLSADLSAVFDSTVSLARISNADALIVGKSTVPVGTATQLRSAMDGVGATDVMLAWNPEFLREGYALQDTLAPDRLVLGVASVRAEQRLRDVYAPLINDGVPVVVTDFATAELAKVSANAFLATKVSFINAIADLCQAAGADVVQLADALGHDSRIGRRYLHAGVGFGGGCLPKDIHALRHRAGDFGIESLQELLRVVDEINVDRHHQVLRRALQLIPAANAKVAVLGATFKPHTDDLRHSPALWVAEHLSQQVAAVSVYDPRAAEPAGNETLQWASSIEEACQNADLLIHLTDWPEFREIDPAELKPVMADGMLLDARNCLDLELWRSAGWTAYAMGRP